MGNRQSMRTAAEAISTEMKGAPPSKFALTRTSTTCCLDGGELVNSLLTRSAQRSTFLIEIYYQIPHWYYASLTNADPLGNTQRAVVDAEHV